MDAERHAEMLWKGEPTWVSPRLSMNIGICAFCLNWRALITPIWATFAEAKEQINCQECFDKIAGSFDRVTQDDVREIEVALAGVQSMLALLRVGMTGNEAGEVLGFS